MKICLNSVLVSQHLNVVFDIWEKTHHLVRKKKKKTHQWPKPCCFDEKKTPYQIDWAASRWEIWDSTEELVKERMEMTGAESRWVSSCSIWPSMWLSAVGSRDRERETDHKGRFCYLLEIYLWLFKVSF